ncbi:MAG: PKD domain-containing protein [Thermoplasmatota archaeon]
MVKGINTRNTVIFGIAALAVITMAVGYFVLFGQEGDPGEEEENGNGNHPPEADAGYDLTIMSGQEVLLSANRSYDKDGDDLFYFWDMDAGIDSNSDGMKDNDKDVVGMDISYFYPPPSDTLTYIVTLNVTDGAYDDPETMWDTDTIRVTILVNTTEEAPEVPVECQYQEALPPFDAHFVIVVGEVTSEEFIANFTFVIESAEGDRIQEGYVSDIILLPRNATVRFIDTPAVTLMDANDNFNIREGGDIEEGCWFYLYYKDFRGPAGQVELTR